MAVGLLWFGAVILIVLAVRAGLRGKRGGTMTGAVAGTMYDWMNEDKRKAVEVIAEGGAEASDPETADARPRPGRSKRAGRAGKAGRRARSGRAGRTTRTDKDGR